jgi:hypothetical protein
MFFALFVDAFPRSISIFSELLHSVIYDERFRGLSRRLFAIWALPHLPLQHAACLA